VIAQQIGRWLMAMGLFALGASVVLLRLSRGERLSSRHQFILELLTVGCLLATAWLVDALV
jgi:hypothetical protein